MKHLTAQQEQDLFYGALGEMTGVPYGGATDYSSYPVLGPGIDPGIVPASQAKKDLQTLLIAGGYSIPGGATGRYDADTKAAVMKFQANNGITPTGSVGTATWEKLYKKSKGEKTTATVTNIFNALQTGLTQFMPLVGEELEVTPSSTPSGPSTDTKKKFPWGLAIGVTTAIILLGGGAYFVMRKPKLQVEVGSE